MGAQVEKLRANKNVEMLLTTTVSAIERAGSGLLLRLSGDRTLAVDGVFVAVGVEPQTKLVENQLSLDAGGYILAGEDTATAIPGVFAAGDCRKKPLRQVSTAVGDGATAALHGRRLPRRERQRLKQPQKTAREGRTQRASRAVLACPQRNAGGLMPRHFRQSAMMTGVPATYSSFQTT